MALRCRKNQATLSAQEKSRFVAAMLGLKANGTYDQYVQTHMNAMAAAHRGPAFLPWHREYLRRLELDLQAIISRSRSLTGTGPSIAPPAHRLAADFMGGDGRPSDGQAMTGPFALNGNWALAFDGPFLRLRFGVSASALPVPADVVNAINNETVMTSRHTPILAFWVPQSLRRLDLRPAAPQSRPRVGGRIDGAVSSPNDPVFFLHHCFVDKLWADWQRTSGLGRLARLRRGARPQPC